jgi:hypothetical protein
MIDHDGEWESASWLDILDWRIVSMAVLSVIFWLLVILSLAGVVPFGLLRIVEMGFMSVLALTIVCIVFEKS